MRNPNFKKTSLATTLSLILGAMTMAPTYAAETEKSASAVEVIEVTGIRSSLVKSMDIKRSANGVVDAITAEDIGKFPDGNLAESLQRITGVSIDRSNGEGAKITVRGMGPEFNMVTLNGRQMPTTGGRSFDFGHIATDGVSGVEVYKTANVTLPSGGIGATVNMTTARPLNDPGLKAVLSGKAVHETSIENVGDKFTPEFSGLFSNTFADDTIGVLVSGSYQDRNNREESSAVDQWYANRSVTETANITDNNQRADGYNWYPQNAGYSISNNSRQRTNAQAVLQFKPVENMTATIDYTYSKVEFENNFNAFGIWFNAEGSTLAGEINERGTYVSVTEAANDFANNVGRGQTKAENKSLGLNIEWQATDNLHFTLDAHDSSAENLGVGLGNDAFLIIGNTSCPQDCWGFPTNVPTASIDEKTANFPGSGVPTVDMSFVDGSGNPQAALLASDIGSLFGGATDNDNYNDMNQIQLKGTWVNDNDDALSSIDFGYSRTNQKFKSTNRFEQFAMGWWGATADVWPDDQWQEASTNGILSDFGGGQKINQDTYFTQSFDYILNGFNNFTPDPIWADWYNDCCLRGSWPQETFGAGEIDGDARVEETITSLYARATFDGEFNNMPYSIVAGVRYEEADVLSRGLETPVTDIIWTGGNEFQYTYASEQTFTDATATSKQFLPSLDVGIDVTDDLVTRFSYSRAVARPNIGDLRSTTDFPGNPKIGTRKMITGNPSLKPYIADNFDLSLEYYYGDASYASVGYFKKIVDNFLVDSYEEVNFAGIGDVYNGPRAEQARAELEAEGTQATDANVFARINQNMGTGSSAIAPNGDDPLAVFDKQSKANGETANLFGWELAVQHLFGETGFGLMVNATIVNGDVEADRNAIEQDFALPGMSNSANFAVFYENDDLSARISYNWRDEFLNGFDQHGSPIYTEEYYQVDANVSYSVSENFTVFAEALNVTEETQRTYVRYSEQLLRANQYGARYNFGARYTF